MPHRPTRYATRRGGSSTVTSTIKAHAFPPARAVPFLLELLDRAATPDRHWIIYFLVGLALGYEEAWLPLGVSVSDAFPDTTEGAEIPDPETWENLDDEVLDMLVARWERQAYEAVALGVDQFVRLVADGDADVRMAALFAVACLPSAR